MDETWSTEGMCRCCHDKGSMRSLGAMYSNEKDSEIYSVLLRETFNINVSPVISEDQMSSYCICQTCVLRLRDATKFKRQVLECEEKFTQCYLKELNQTIKHESAYLDETGNDIKCDDSKSLDLFIGPMSDTEADDEPLSVLAGRSAEVKQEAPEGTGRTEEPIPSKAKKKRLSCNYCEKKFSYNGSLEVHMKIHTGEKIHRCLLCDVTCGLNRELTKHINEKHSEDGKFPCKLCNSIFDKATKLKSHLRLHFVEKFKCNHCDKDFVRKKGLKEHLKVHSGERKYSCHLCSKTFGHNHTLKSHILTHTGERPYVCDVCGRRFPQRTHLKRHIYIIHAGLKPHSCNICNKQFSSKSYLAIHERVHSGEKPFSCDVCSKNFTAYTTLKVHMRVHTGLKPYTCTFCSRQFAQMASFKLHERTHTGAKPYSCKVCKKRFSDNGYLKIHMRIHTNEKPFECDVCKRSFRETGQLKRHKRIHTGVKPYTCKVCNKQIGNLSKHMRVHDERTVSCRVCNKQYSVNSLKLHLRVHSDGQFACDQCVGELNESGDSKIK